MNIKHPCFDVGDDIYYLAKANKDTKCFNDKGKHVYTVKRGTLFIFSSRGSYDNNDILWAKIVPMTPIRVTTDSFESGRCSKRLFSWKEKYRYRQDPKSIKALQVKDVVIIGSTTYEPVDEEHAPGRHILRPPLYFRDKHKKYLDEFFTSGKPK